MLATISVSVFQVPSLGRLSVPMSRMLRRPVPFQGTRDGAAVAPAVASLGGAPKNPVWYYNLKKNPHVELQDGATKLDCTAREITGDEKAVWWERAVEAWPDYANYQTKTDRQIPVFVLEPME